MALLPASVAGTVPYGACCYPDGTCSEPLSDAECQAGGGTPQGEFSECANVDCPQPAGACCLSDYSCQVVPQDECSVQDGDYVGDDTDCTACPQPGACCLGYPGGCDVVSESECTGLGGQYLGEQTECAACPQPAGACCLPDFGCDVVSEGECTAAGGQYVGDQTECTACPSPICEVPGEPCADCPGCSCAPEVTGGLPDSQLVCVDTDDCQRIFECYDCVYNVTVTDLEAVTSQVIIGPTGCYDSSDCPPGYACVEPLLTATFNANGGGGICCATATRPTTTTVTSTTTTSTTTTSTTTTSTTTTSTTLPSNNACDTPAPIEGCEITVPFDNTAATTEGLPHAACESFGSTQVYNDLWYCWDPPFDAGVTIDTCDQTNLDTRLNVYGPFANCEEAALLCPAEDGDLLECNDDFCATRSQVAFEADGNSVYLVRLGSFFSSQSGSGTFTVGCQERVETCTGEPGGVCQGPNPTSDGTNAVLSVPGLSVAADDFALPVSAEITHLAWWGVYGKSHQGPPSDCGPGAGDSFRVTYYADAGGLPGAVLAGPLPLLNVAKCETGALVDVGPNAFLEYQYEGDHAPVALEAATIYWVEISNDTVDAECRWRWRTSDEGNGGFAVNPTTGWEPRTPDLAFCYNTIRQTCRSAGYYMTHSSTEGGSRDVTGELLAAAGCLEICGEVIRTTMVDDADSAVEALCESPRGTPERQLARQLTALGLNCIASGYGPLCHGWAGVADLFAECNAVCEDGPDGRTVEECIEAVACVNTGGDPFATSGACYTGACSDNGAPCSMRDRSKCGDPSAATCDSVATTCYGRDICNPSVGVCVEPGTAANPRACKRARASACSILEVGRTTELDCDYGVQLDEESCCNDPAECDDGEFCTTDECVVGPGCSNTPIPLCCEDNGDCANPLPTCDVAVNMCMECGKDEDCDDGDVCTTDVCNAGSCSHEEIPDCCRDDSECADPAPLCEPVVHRCVQCLDDGDCTDPAQPYCNVFFDNICVECQDDGDCDDGIGCTLDFCVGPGICTFPPGGPVAPPGPCEDNCRCDPELGRVCDPIPGCCLTDDDCSDPAAPVCRGDYTCGPETDTCGAAGTIACEGSVTFDNTAFTTDPSDPPFSCYWGGAAQGVGTAWYTFVATGSAACLDTNSSAVSDTLLAVYDGSCGSLNELACSEDEGVGLRSELCVDGLIPGQTYYVQVASWSDASRGSITLDLTCPEPPSSCQTDEDCTDPLAPICEGLTCRAASNTCAEADQSVTGCDITIPFDTTGATTDGPAHAACEVVGQDTTQNDIWTCWVAPQDAHVTAATCGLTPLDTRLDVYGPFADCAAASSACGGLSDAELLACDDDDCVVGFQSIVDFEASSGSAYLIRLGSWSSGQWGTGELAITCATTTSSTTTTSTTTSSTTTSSTTPEPPLAETLGVYSDPRGETCDLYDITAGLVSWYVVHNNTAGATASQFAAPMPACMTASGCVHLGDVPVFPVTIGNSQTGVTIGYGACLASPIHVLTMNFFCTGSTPPDCLYPVVPDPDAPSGQIEIVDCAANLSFGSGVTSVVNPASQTCGAGPD